MGNFLYVISAISIIAWAIGFIGYNIGGIITFFVLLQLLQYYLNLLLVKNQSKTI
jgi:uncharacterized membrane protein